MKKLIILLSLLVIFIAGCGKEEEQAPVLNNESTSVEEVPSQAVEPVEEVEDQPLTVRILADALNVRRSHGLDSEVVGLIKKDALVEVLEIYEGPDGMDWYKIETESYMGWIAGWYCMEETAYVDKILRGNLLPAFEGKIPGIKGSLNSSIEDINNLYDQSLETTNYWGTPGLYNDKILYLFGDDGMLLISLEPESEIFGLKAKATLEAVKSHLGPPDTEEKVEDPEGNGLYEDGSLVLTYITGSYVTKFVFNTDLVLTRIELARHVI